MCLPPPPAQYWRSKVSPTMSVVPASSGQLRFFPHSTYNQSFFLLRVNSLTFNDQPAQISSENRHLTLGCCNPPVSITFDRLITEVDARLCCRLDSFPGDSPPVHMCSESCTLTHAHLHTRSCSHNIYTHTYTHVHTHA